MGLITLGLDSWRPPRREERSITLADFPSLASILAPPLAAGVTVTEKTAIKNSAFWNGVDLISSDVAKLPRHHYKRLSDDARERLRGTPIDRLMQQPNPETNAFDFWKTLVYHVLTWGNGYAEIEFDGALRPLALWTITPEKMEPKVETVTLPNGRTAARFFYIYEGKRRIEAEDIVHVKGLGYDGVRGHSVVAMARLSLGLGLAAEQFGASFFGNGAWPGVLLEHPKTISPDAEKRLRASWDQLMRGPQRAMGTAVLEEGMKATKIGIPPEDAQFLETREFQVVEVARWLNLPPHKLKHKMGERPGGNLRESELDYLSSTLDPWLIRIEQELDRKLITAGARATQYIEHERNALLRMLPEERAEAYKAYFDMGVIDEDYIAQKENFPKPKPKPTSPAPAKPAEEDEMSQEDPAVANAQRALIVDIVGRYARREAESLKRGPKKDTAAFMDWAARHYADEVPVLAGMLAPAVRLILATKGSREDPDALAVKLAREYTERSLEVLNLLPARGFDEHREQVSASWQNSRPLLVADQLLAVRGTIRRVLPAPGGHMGGYRGMAEGRTDPPAGPMLSLVFQVPEAPPPMIQNILPPPVISVAAPDVRAEINVPPQLPPEVNVNVPEPIVRVDAPVTVNVPPPKATRLKVERDRDGNLAGLTPATD